MRKILFFLFALPLVVLADGDCHLVQQVDGSWQIVCSGTGIQIQYETVTNDVYIVENCEELKSELSAISRNLSVGVSSMQSQMNSLGNEIGDYGYPDDLLIPYQIAYEYITPTPGSDYVDINLYNLSQDLDGLISDFQCGSCPTNGASGGGSGGSCCPEVDLSQIVDLINQEIYALQSISNAINSLKASVDSGFFSTTNAIYSGFGSTTNALYLTHQDLTNYLARIVSLKNDISSFGAPTRIDYMHLMQKRYSNLEGAPVSVTLSSDTYLKNYRNLFYIPKNYGYLGSIYASSALSTYLLQSINEFQYHQYLYQYPTITNTLVRFETNVTNDLATLVAVAKMVSDLTDIAATDYVTVSQRLASVSSNRVTNWFERVELLLAGLLWKDQQSVGLQQDERDELDEKLNTSSLQGQRLEIEGAFKPADLISFDYNLSEHELNLPQFGDDLPQYLFIEFSANQASGIEDADATSIKIDLTNSNVIGFISFIRSMFRLLWWGLLSYLIWWLFGLFLRGLEWLRGIIVGIKF